MKTLFCISWGDSVQSTLIRSLHSSWVHGFLFISSTRGCVRKTGLKSLHPEKMVEGDGESWMSKVNSLRFLRLQISKSMLVRLQFTFSDAAHWRPYAVKKSSITRPMKISFELYSIKMWSCYHCNCCKLHNFSLLHPSFKTWIKAFSANYI